MYVVGERGGVEHRGALVLGGQVAHDATHVGDEAHVEHAVRLVDHERVHALQVHHVALAEVQQTPGRRHEQVHGGLLELLALAVHVHAAVHGEGAESAILADRVGVLADLYDELARRCDYERARSAALFRTVLGRAEIAREDRDEERGSLAGTGLRTSIDFC